MVVRPQEILETLYTAEKEEIRALEYQLDVALCSFDGTRLSIASSLMGSTNRIRNAMLKKYRVPAGPLSSRPISVMAISIGFHKPGKK